LYGPEHLLLVTWCGHASAFSMWNIKAKRRHILYGTNPCVALCINTLLSFKIFWSWAYLQVIPQARCAHSLYKCIYAQCYTMVCPIKYVSSFRFNISTVCSVLYILMYAHTQLSYCAMNVWFMWFNDRSQTIIFIYLINLHSNDIAIL
jgi:hypothetical protein